MDCQDLSEGNEQTDHLMYKGEVLSTFLVGSSFGRTLTRTWNSPFHKEGQTLVCQVDKWTHRGNHRRKVGSRLWKVIRNERHTNFFLDHLNLCYVISYHPYYVSHTDYTVKPTLRVQFIRLLENILSWIHFLHIFYVFNRNKERETFMGIIFLLVKFWSS